MYQNINEHTQSSKYDSCVRKFKISSPLARLPDGEPFSLNYQPSRIDRNALFALNTIFDKDRVSEVRSKYHRAFLSLDNLKKDLLEYDCPKFQRSLSNAYYMVLESIRKQLKPKELLIPMTTGAVAKYPDFPKSKSPGIPLKQQGYATKGDALADPTVLHDIRKLWYKIEAGVKVELPDTAAYARAQISTRDVNKVRATWGIPMCVYMQEATWFYPVLEHLKQHETSFIAYGVETGKGGMRYIEEALLKFPDSNKLMSDWSKYDKTIPPWLIRDAFNIIAEWIDWTQVRDSTGKCWPVREYRSKRRWRKMVDYFINTPVRLSDGTRYLKVGGVPSGSCWTNVIDSIINAIVMRYLIYDVTGELPLFDLYLGDDGLCITRRPLDLEGLSALAYTNFSMLLNDNKSYQTLSNKNVHFCI